MRVWTYAVLRDVLNPHDTVGLRKLLQKTKSTPSYDKDGIPVQWYTNRTAASYIQRIFEDDPSILQALGIESENCRHIFWKAHSGGTDVTYFQIWKKGGLQIHGPEPFELDYRSPSSHYGGFAAFFSSHRVVLELGSGEGVGLTQLHNGVRNKDEITWIGIDALYETNEIDISQRGELQFAKDDFHTLEQIPDNSVDRIMSVQAAFYHGDVARVTEQVTRVAKLGAILRAEPTIDYVVRAVNSLTAHGWDVYTMGEGSLVARLT